jgi:hypothetical protein
LLRRQTRKKEKVKKTETTPKVTKKQLQKTDKKVVETKRINEFFGYDENY